jgi:hypothetical protein
MIDDLKWFLNNFSMFKKKLTNFNQNLDIRDKNLSSLFDSLVSDIDRKINRIIDSIH